MQMAVIVLLLVLKVFTEVEHFFKHNNNRAMHSSPETGYQSNPDVGMLHVTSKDINTFYNCDSYNEW